jgi:hypothetical protein
MRCLSVTLILGILMSFLMSCGGGGGPVDPPPPAVSIVGTWTMWAPSAPTDTWEWKFTQDGAGFNLYNLDWDNPDVIMATGTTSGGTFTFAGEMADGGLVFEYEGSGTFSASAIGGTVTTTELLDGDVQDTYTEAFAGSRST